MSDPEFRSRDDVGDRGPDEFRAFEIAGGAGPVAAVVAAQGKEARNEYAVRPLGSKHLRRGGREGKREPFGRGVGGAT